MAFIPVWKQKPAPNPSRPEFTQSHNEFAFRLLKTVLQADTARNNKLISPLSVYLNLSMLCNGAVKDTRTTITQTLGTEGIDIPYLNSECKDLLQQLPIEDSKVKVSAVESCWYNQRKLGLSPIYESLLSNFYYAATVPSTFAGRQAVDQINHWADQNTDHQILSVMQQASPRDCIYLLSAFAFRGDWTAAFNPEYTHDGNFYVRPGRVRPVPMMQRTGVIHTYADTAFTMVELPCGAGDNYSLLVLLPENEQLSITDWLYNFTPIRLNTALNKVTDQWVQLTLPRWEASNEISNLKPVLEKMGMASVEEADLSAMFPTGGSKASLSQIVQGTSIQVNETGLAAAPSSGGSISLSDPGRPNARQIMFNRPFFYVLMEKPHNAILLSGIVNDPSGKEVMPAPAPPPVKTRTKQKKQG